MYILCAFEFKMFKEKYDDNFFFFLDFMVSLKTKILWRDIVFNFWNSDIIWTFFMNYIIICIFEKLRQNSNLKLLFKKKKIVLLYF